MTKRMTEPAKLYWKDLDVLEEARTQLVEFLDVVKASFDEGVQTAWKKEDLGEATQVVGWNDGGGGRWFNHLDPTRSRLQLSIADPRRARSDPSTYDVVAWIPKSKLKEASRVEGMLDKVQEFAVEEGLQWDWSQSESLSTIHVPIKPESAEDTASLLVEEVLKLLRIAARFDDAIDESDSQT